MKGEFIFMKIGEMLERDYSIEEKGVTPPPAKITKEDLYKIIEEKERDIASLHEEIDKLEKYKAFEEGADATKAMYDSFVHAGFDKEQAFKLTLEMISNVFKTGLINVNF